ncbi:MAG: hypothetical protein JWQ96_2846 [Segetibacter sp.]|nr:hypothetical protein [Segetibacter sp.]
MFSFFKEEKPGDVKGIRNALLQFIKEQLQKAEGGEGSNIRGIAIYITCQEEDRHAYEAAVFADEPDRFKVEEVQRIADDFAIALPATWSLEILFAEPPKDALKVPNADASIAIASGKKPLIYKEATGYLRVLNGEAEKEVYTLQSVKGKVNIGRERKVQTIDGFYRENQIAFPDKSSNESNRSISRQHAHIEWDPECAAFCLFADEGGIPPMNKMKVRKADGEIIKVHAVEIGHQLQEGDQIMLGESAVLEFTYRALEN